MVAKQQLKTQGNASNAHATNVAVNKTEIHNKNTPTYMVHFTPPAAESKRARHGLDCQPVRMDKCTVFSRATTNHSQPIMGVDFSKGE